MDATIILPCFCEHAAQDQLHGRNNRVHNIAPDGLAYCTVCAPSKTHHRNTVALSPVPLMNFPGVPARRQRVGKPVPKNRR
jgi:hypothetical protein